MLLSKPHKALLIASGKGGVGKSTIASLLALSFANEGLGCALLDADLTGPSLPTIFSLEGLSPLLKNKRVQPFFKFGLHLLSYGNFISNSEPVTMRGPLLTAALSKMIDDVSWPEVDLFLIDMPPSTSDLSLTCCGAIDQPYVLLVCQNDPLSLSDARRAANHYFALNVPVIGIVESMSFCETDHNAIHSLCASLEIPYLGAIPYSKKIRESVGRGRIQELIGGSGPEGEAIGELSLNTLKTWQENTGAVLDRY